MNALDGEMSWQMDGYRQIINGQWIDGATDG